MLLMFSLSTLPNCLWSFLFRIWTAKLIARLLIKCNLQIWWSYEAYDRSSKYVQWEMVTEVCEFFYVKKVNDSGYHPLTNGVCIFFSSTWCKFLWSVICDMVRIGINTHHICSVHSSMLYVVNKRITIFHVQSSPFIPHVGWVHSLLDWSR